MRDICEWCLTPAVCRFKAQLTEKEAKHARYVRFACLAHEEKTRGLVYLDLGSRQVEFTYEPSGFVNGRVSMLVTNLKHKLRITETAPASREGPSDIVKSAFVKYPPLTMEED